MSQLATAPAGPPPAAASPSRSRWSRRSLVLVAIAVGLLVVSAVRTLSGANDLTSSGTIGAALGLAVPIGMAGLGGLWAERAGVVNIGLEGMMILGTFGAGWIGWQHGPWAGLVAGVLLGAAGGLVHAVATVTFGVDHIVSGVAINILGLGVDPVPVPRCCWTGTPGGGGTQSPPIRSIGALSHPGYRRSAAVPGAQAAGSCVSDLAGIAPRRSRSTSSVMTLLALGLVALTWFVLWRTAFGLRLRSCGEDPYAAESLGVKVYLHKYIAVMVSGGLAGFGGAFLAIVAAGIYREGQTGGRGYIGLAAMIFGNWRPGGLIAGAGLFGYTDAIQLRSGDRRPRAAAAGGGAAGGRRGAAGGARPAGAGRGGGRWSPCWRWSGTCGPTPCRRRSTFMTPYITTLLVLALASQRLRMPRPDGLVYRRGEGH